MALWEGILWMSFLGGMVYGSAVWLLHIGSFQGIGYCGKKESGILGSLALGNAGIIVAICELERRMQIIPGENRILYTGAEEVLLGLLAGGLLAAAYMDAKSSYVYNYVWWWCLSWTGILLGFPVAEGYMKDGLRGIADSFDIQQAAAVVLFVLLQQILFARMYGRADCHAFSACALACCAWHGNLLWFLVHMLLALTLLAAVQLCRRNVTPDGKLHVPKPFIPYIVVTFWVQIPAMLYLQSGTAYIYA